MDMEEDLYLIENIKKNKTSCDDELKKLVSKHSGIYLEMVNKYTSGSPDNLHSMKDDLISDKEYYIYKAALRFDKSRNVKFSTFLGNEARWICLNKFNRSPLRKECAPLDSLINTFSEDDTEKSLTDRDVLDRIFKFTEQSNDKRVHKIFKTRYQNSTQNKLTPWSTVSQSINLSIQGTINLHNKTIKLIKELLGKEI